MKCMNMRLRVFQKNLDSTQIFQKQVFQLICPQKLNRIKIKEYIILDGQNKFIHYIMYQV